MRSISAAAIEPIEFRQRVPRHPVAQVMRGMQIVEQEQRPENPGVLDDRRSPLDLGHGAMFGERTHQREARARIDEARDIEESGIRQTATTQIRTGAHKTRWRARVRRAPRSPRQASRNRSRIRHPSSKGGSKAIRPRSVVRT